MSSSRAAQLLGARLRDARTHVGISQMDLSHLAGMNVANCGRIERGEGNPSFETIIRLAGVLELDVAELVAGISARDLPSGRRRYTAVDFVREREARN